MAERGRNINIFLMDKVPNGRLKCTLANWTGVVYRIPRTCLDLCKGRDDLNQSGIYFLFEAREDGYNVGQKTQNLALYVGQAGARKNGGGILSRLQEHVSDKDYWTEAVVLITSNNSFGPTEISYLENRFCALAREANRCTVRNGNEPTRGNVTEEKESELEEFIEYSKLVIGVLEYRVFDPPAEKDKKLDVFFIKRRGANACAVQTPEGFVVLDGSVLSKDTTSSCPGGALTARARYKEAGLLDENMIVREKSGLLFKTPSGAASFVLGSSANGNKEWETEQGETFGEFEKRKNAKQTPKNKGG